MNTKDSAAFFNDDFADLFNDADIELEHCNSSQESVSALIRLIEDEENIEKRLESIRDLILKFIPATSIVDVDKKVLQYVMPMIKNLMGDVLTEINQTLPLTDTNEKSVETFKILQEYLQVCLNILEILNGIIDYILKNKDIDMCYIRSVPLNLIQILHLTFQHCKDSTSLYKNYLDDLKEILSLFKGAHDIHTKLLKLLEAHITINNISEKETILVEQVLNILGEIGEALIDMNVKALADTWKGYMTLTQKFADVLNHSAFSIERPLNFLAGEISRNLDNVLKMDPNNVKSSVQTLKISNFFIRVALKLCDTFWSKLDNICKGSCNLLISVYCFYPPLLRYRGCQEGIVEQISTLIFNSVDPLLDKLLYEPSFFKVFAGFKVQEAKSEGLLFLLTVIFQKLPDLIQSNRKMLQDCYVCRTLNLYFDVVRISYSIFFWKILLSNTNESLYDNNVTNVTSTILLLNQKQYQEVEIVLLKNICEDCIWSGLLAADIWSSVLRLKNPRLSFGTLVKLTEKTKHLFSNSLTNRPEMVVYTNFLQKLYSFLPENYKKAFIDKYSLFFENVHVWKVLKFKDFPNDQAFMMESLLINIMEKIEDFNNGRCTMDDFKFLCMGLDIMSSFPRNDTDIKGVLSTLMNMWNFDVDSDIKNTIFFKQLILKLCQVSNHFILYMGNEHLLLVSMKLCQLVKTDCNIKIQASQILNSLATKPIPHSSEQNQIISAMSEILYTLLLDKNPVVRQRALEVFVHLVNATPHEEIVRNAVKNDKQLQRIVTNFIHKAVQDRPTVDADKYFSLQEVYKFQHRCPDVPSTRVKIANDYMEAHIIHKKPKTVDGDVYEIVDRIISDVELLHKLCGKGNSTKRSVSEIRSILSRQLKCEL